MNHKRYAIRVLEEEHANILRMTVVMRAMSLQMIEQKTLFVDDLHTVIAWIREYADKHHHGKEEAILFQEMLDRLGDMGERMVRGGMYVEHDAGRYHVSQIEEAIHRFNPGDDDAFLDGLTHVLGYADLLVRHATKENDVIYPFGVRSFDDDLLDSIDERTQQFEDQFSSEKYIEQLEMLEHKYMQ